MGDEGADPVSAEELSEPAATWLEEQAAESGASREELLERLVAVVRATEDGGAPATDLDALAERVTELEADTDGKIEDVRERVVQLKRELDTKAPADHDHPALGEQLRTAGATAEAAQSAVGDLEETVEALRETTEQGFDNYEAVLEHLTETTEDLESKVTRVAAALVVTRRLVAELSARAEEQRAVEELKTTANRQGITVADCEQCGESVDLGLLSESACPHCGTAVRGVKPRSGLFGAPTLLQGEPPNPEGAVVDPDGTEAEAAVEALLDTGENTTRPAADGDGTEFVFLGDIEEWGGRDG